MKWISKLKQVELRLPKRLEKFVKERIHLMITPATAAVKMSTYPEEEEGKQRKKRPKLIE